MTKKLNLFRNHYSNEKNNFIAKAFKSNNSYEKSSLLKDDFDYEDYDDSITLDEDINYDNDKYYEFSFDSKNSVEYIYDVYDSDDYID